MNLDEFSTLITNSTELLGLGISVVIMMFTGIQVFLLFKAFEVGNKYLAHHKEKTTIDRELGLIYDSMKKIHELRQIWFYWSAIEEDVYNQANWNDELAFPMIELIGKEFRRKHLEKEEEWKDIRMSLRVNFKLLNNEKINRAFSMIIYLEEAAKMHYFSLKPDFKYEHYQNRIKKIPPSFYSKQNSLGLNTRFEYLLKLLQEKYLEELN